MAAADAFAALTPAQLAAMVAGDPAFAAKLKAALPPAVAKGVPISLFG
jgi:hypothetical protein